MASGSSGTRDQAGPSSAAAGAATGGAPGSPVGPGGWLEVAIPDGFGEEVARIPVVGVAEIDDEHRRLIQHYNTLVQGFARHRDASAFALDFHGLVHRVRQHFEHEERLMVRIGYGGYQFHRQVHKNLVSDAQRFLMDLIGRQERDQCERVAKWFRHWLTNHVMTHDRKIAEFLSDGIWPS